MMYNTGYVLKGNHLLQTNVGLSIVK